MKQAGARWIAAAAGCEIRAEGGSGGSERPGDAEGPGRVLIDSRQAGPGDLFAGLAGERVDGGRFAAAALGAGCWGVIVSPEWADEALAAASERAGGQEGAGGEGVVLVAADPLAALQALARAWRRRLGEEGATVAGITGSVGKTSTKDIARALLPEPVHASAQNLNTEIGLPLSLLAAPLGVRSVVLEMAMRGPGQIAELAAIAEPEIGAITNAGPVHIELLGSIEAVAAAKAEVLGGLADGGLAVVPADAGPLAPFVEAERERLRILRFGEGGDVVADGGRASGGGLTAEVKLRGLAAELAEAAGSPLAAGFEFPFTAPHNLVNALAAIAIGLAAGGRLDEMAKRAGDISFSRFRGEVLRFGPGFDLVNDCYNANPVSMRAALQHLGTATDGRRIAVLGLMAELGPETERYHSEIGSFARAQGVDLLVGVGADARWYEPDQLVADPAEAAELVAGVVSAGDTVLVKGSRSAGLEAVAEGLAALFGGEAGERIAGRGGQG